jgi:hypothetical protein
MVMVSMKVSVVEMGEGSSDGWRLWWWLSFGRYGRWAVVANGERCETSLSLSSSRRSFSFSPPWSRVAMRFAVDNYFCHPPHTESKKECTVRYVVDILRSKKLAIYKLSVNSSLTYSNTVLVLMPSSLQ